jgi:hypothetical protein
MVVISILVDIYILLFSYTSINRFRIKYSRLPDNKKTFAFRLSYRGRKKSDMRAMNLFSVIYWRKL